MISMISVRIAYLLFYSIPTMISMNYQNYPTGHSKLLYHFKDLWQLMGLPDQMKANLSIPTKKLFFKQLSLGNLVTETPRVGLKLKIFT